MLSGISRPLTWLVELLRGTTTGEPTINEETILTSAAVWYAMTTIAGDVGKMPLEPRRITNNGKGSEAFWQSPSYRLLRDEANGYQTSDCFKEQVQLHALSWGNGRAYIKRNAAQEPVELITLRPDATITTMVKGEKWHVTQPFVDDPIYELEELKRTVSSGQLGKGMYAIPDRDVLHIIGFSYYGVEGKSLAHVAKESIGSDLSAQRYNRDQLNNGMASRAMLQAPPGTLQDEEEAQKMLKNFREDYARKNKANVAGILRDGITLADVSKMSNVDAQFIEQRKFSRQEVMLWFGLQHIPGDNSSVSYNSLEQKQLAYLSSCLDRWLVRWEMQCDMKLRTEKDKRSRATYFKFNRATWLQTDAISTSDVLVKLIHAKIITRNEARDKIEMNPVDGGDEFENPAIQVKESVAAPSQQNTAIDMMFEDLLTTELNQITQAVKKKSCNDFMNWLEKHYEKWQGTYERKSNKLGLDVTEVTDKVEERKNKILEACDVQPEALAASVLKVINEIKTENAK